MKGDGLCASKISLHWLFLAVIGTTAVEIYLFKPVLMTLICCCFFLLQVAGKSENRVMYFTFLTMSVCSKHLLFMVSSHLIMFQLNSFMLLGNHCTQFLADTSKYADPVVFHMHGSSKNALLGNQKPLTSLPELYKGKSMCCVHTVTLLDVSLSFMFMFQFWFWFLFSVLHSSWGDPVDRMLKSDY